MTGYRCKGCGWATTRKSDLSRNMKLCLTCIATRIVENVMGEVTIMSETWQARHAATNAGLARAGKARKRT